MKMIHESNRIFYPHFSITNFLASFEFLAIILTRMGLTVSMIILNN